MKRNTCLLFFSVLLTAASVKAQQKDSVFTSEQLLWFVKNYHPVAVQGNLLKDKGASTIRRARGAFDPFIHSNLDQKAFDDKKYFNLLNNGLKIPTWYGVELKTGIDQNSGSFLNPENNVPPGGLWYGGLSVPLAQGLAIDNRRAALKQAQIYAQSTRAEQQALMNELLFDAIKEYWKWMEAWNQYQVYTQSLALAQSLFEAVKQSYRLGDRPAIDTLEAFIQVQNRQMNLNEARLEYQNQTLALSNYLWYEQNTPLVITDSLHPPLYEDLRMASAPGLDSLQTTMEQLPASHPDLQLYRFKLSSMDVERRLKTENLKPRINLHYNAINEPVGSNVFSGLSAQNYKWGVSFSFPLLLRQQRGDLQLTRLKIRDTELEQQQKQLELQNKLKSYFNEQLNLHEQVTLYSGAVINYARLLEGERKKFDIGESSLFLVNTRETGWLMARIKLIELMAKYHIAVAGMQYASGGLFLR